MNFIIYEKATGHIVEQRSAGGCYTVNDLFQAVYGLDGAAFMQTLADAIPSLTQVPGDGSVEVNPTTKVVQPTPGWVAPVVLVSPPVV